MLPGTLSGPAYLISHGGGAFPDLDLVLRGDGVEVVLVGHTHISRAGITTSTFESLPDVPVSSVKVDLPVGTSSALTANGRLCGKSLVAPTTLIAQSGARVAHNTKVTLNGCAIVLLSHRLRGTHLLLSVLAPEPGRLSVSARGARHIRSRVRKAGQVRLSVALDASTAAALHRGRGSLRLRIAFTPSAGHNSSSLATKLR